MPKNFGPATMVQTKTITNTQLLVATLALAAGAAAFLVSPPLQQGARKAGGTQQNFAIGGYSCTDSDNGQTPGTAGTVTVTNNTTGEDTVVDDQCSSVTSPGAVIEGSCDSSGHLTTTIAPCTEGCSNGACVSYVH